MNRIKLPILILIISLMTGYSYAKDVQQTSKTPVTSAQLDTKNISTKDLINMVNTPTTPIEILENLKFALNNDLLLREDFYTDENLKQFTGGTKVNRGATKASTPNVIDLEIFGFSDGMRHITSENNVDLGISLRFFWKIKDDGKIRASISGQFSDHDPRVNYQAIKSLFGQQWQALKQPRWSSNQLYRAPTAPHGNQHWGHTILRSNSVEERTHFTFGPSALVEYMTLNLEQK